MKKSLTICRNPRVYLRTDWNLSQSFRWIFYEISVRIHWIFSEGKTVSPSVLLEEPIDLSNSINSAAGMGHICSDPEVMTSSLMWTICRHVYICIFVKSIIAPCVQITHFVFFKFQLLDNYREQRGKLIVFPWQQNFQKMHLENLNRTCNMMFESKFFFQK